MRAKTLAIIRRIGESMGFSISTGTSPCRHINQPVTFPTPESIASRYVLTHKLCSTARAHKRCSTARVDSMLQAIHMQKIARVLKLSVTLCNCNTAIEKIERSQSRFGGFLPLCGSAVSRPVSLYHLLSPRRPLHKCSAHKYGPSVSVSVSVCVSVSISVTVSPPFSISVPPCPRLCLCLCLSLSLYAFPVGRSLSLATPRV